jgi:hypothetical protein
VIADHPHGANVDNGVSGLQRVVKVDFVLFVGDAIQRVVQCDEVIGILDVANSLHHEFPLARGEALALVDMFADRFDELVPLFVQPEHCLDRASDTGRWECSALVFLSRLFVNGGLSSVDIDYGRRHEVRVAGHIKTVASQQ